MGSSSKKKRSREEESDEEFSGEGTDSSEERRRKQRKKEKKAKKAKKKHHERSPSPSPVRKSSGGGDGGGGNLSKLAESAEEKAARKAAKEARKIASMFGYTSHSNPFGDSNLHQQFVWKAKEKGQGKPSSSSSSASAKSKLEENQRRLELIKEIEKVRKRREDREKELEEMERLKAEEARLREASMYDDWERKEEEFHLEQARVRSKIRLIEGREKPIDNLARNLLLFGTEEKAQEAAIKYKGKTSLDLSNIEAELRESYLIFDNLDVEQLKELQGEIREYQSLEAHGLNKEFWTALALVCKDELRKAGAQGGQDPLSSGGVHSAVAVQLEEMFGGKSVNALERMRKEIQEKVDHNDGTVDVDYWENVLAELQVHRAKAYLRELHQQMLLRQLQRLEEKKAEVARRRMERLAKGRGEDEEEEEEGGTAPTPEPEPENTGYDDSNAAMQMVSAERGKGMGQDEDTLGKGDEIDLSDKTYWWHDKYRPRKPRYFNRVKTGWDWNKYNQTHYDHDNPPPKTIQGYKFNIFYPDLIDKTKTPSFSIEKCDNPDFCIIRFHAGPPYEDVAFKIFNREWERSHKRGFKCLFERGILHLYFNFKRMRYRR